ncbi:CLUMA_CG015926, isoform A [Clunio marinus]|uniref:CLUMA_CG015926, isoform A n=1 Tax=Clunio marinus TaxID=568069 RepID=A0A1J1IRH1_9DIPT|nr:CLUMA_CG015926, isoform A [Clunio marinus]
MYKQKDCLLHNLKHSIINRSQKWFESITNIFGLEQQTHHNLHPLRIKNSRTSLFILDLSCHAKYCCQMSTKKQEKKEEDVSIII